MVKHFLILFLSALLILAQATPSFAADTLRARNGGSPTVQAGLEERLRRAEATPTSQPDLQSPPDLGTFQPTGLPGPFPDSEIWRPRPGSGLEGKTEIYVRDGKVIGQRVEGASSSIVKLARPAPSVTTGLEERWDRGIADYYKGKTVAVLGGRGFVGGWYLDRLLRDYGEMIERVKGLTTQDPNLLRKRWEGLPAAKKLEAIQGNHIHVGDLRKLLEGAKIIVDTAGLAWQHLPGGIPATLQDELRENAVSAAFMGLALQPGQRLIWTSSNASDYLFARLSREDQEKLSREIDERASRTVQWVNGLGDRVPSREEIDAWVQEDVSGHGVQEFLGGPEGKDPISGRSASYPYSKLMGERILKLLAKQDGKDIRVLKISDVYGPGQGLGRVYWDPRSPRRQTARRLQWLLAVHEAIREGQYKPWARKPAESGFKKEDAQLSQTVFDDVAAPTYVSDVVKMIFRAGVVDLPKGKVVLEVSAPWMTNVEMAQAVRDAIGTKAAIVPGKKILRVDPESADSDLALLGMDGQLTPLQQGIQEHLSWWRSQAPRSGLEEVMSGVTRTEVGPPIRTFTELNEALSSFTRVEVPALVGSRRVLIVTPDAVGRVLTAASLFSGEPVLIELIAQDPRHGQRILAGLEQMGLSNVRVHDLEKEFGGNLGRAITDLELPHWQAGRETLLVTAMTGLEAIARFLGVPLPESTRAGLEAIAQRSQSVWM